MSTLLSVNNYYYYRGGAETVFLEHNKLLAGAGWGVVPFSMRHPKNLPSEWSDFFIEELELGNEYGVLGRLRRAPKVVYSFEARRKIAALIERVRPDICHAHNIYHHLSPSILATLRAHAVPTIITLHDLKLACPAYNMLTHDGICERCKGGRLHNVVVHRCIKGSLAMSAIIYSEAVLHRALRSYERAVARFIVPSRFFIEKFAEWGFARERFVHVPNFVAAASYRPSFAPGRDFVFAGRISREKGLATLIKAAALAGTPARIVGTGPAFAEMRTLAESLHAPVTFSGYLTGDALTEAIASARALVLPSECYENAPMSILEAYALGKPVIGARIGGIPELILEGRTGASFECRSVESLASNLTDFNAAPDTRIEEMGRAARAHLEQEFSASRYLERILAIYRDVIPDRTAARA